MWFQGFFSLFFSSILRAVLITLNFLRAGGNFALEENFLWKLIPKRGSVGRKSIRKKKCTRCKASWKIIICCDRKIEKFFILLQLLRWVKWKTCAYSTILFAKRRRWRWGKQSSMVQSAFSHSLQVSTLRASLSRRPFGCSRKSDDKQHWNVIRRRTVNQTIVKCLMKTSSFRKMNARSGWIET